MMKKIIIVCCFAAMLMTISSKCALAAEIQEEANIDLASQVSESNGSEPEQFDMNLLSDEELVGVGPVTVGDGVTATLNKKTGAVEFYSDGGTLWRDWINKSGFDKQYIKSIKVSSGTVYLPKDSNRIFNLSYYGDGYYTSNLETIDLSGFDTSNVVNMQYMFDECCSLKSLDLTGFDTSNVQYMNYLFTNCYDLTTVNMSGLNTTNVKSMCGMFHGCNSLTTVDLSGLETPNLTNLGDMFFQCWRLQTVDLSSFDTSNVTSFGGMFIECGIKGTLDLSNFDTSKAKSMDYMFEWCTGLTALDLSHFDTSNVEHMGAMFEGCSSLTSLDLSCFDTANVENMSHMFSGCSSLTTIDLSSFDTSNVVSMSSMFSRCSSLTSLELNGFDTSNVVDMDYMFSGCSSLTSLELNGFDTSNVVDMNGMFSGCSSLITLDLSVFNTSNVSKMSSLFYGCSSLNELDLSNFDTSSAYYYSEMFKNCAVLNLLKTPNINKKKIELPTTMYDEDSNEYDELPIDSVSIVLTSNKPAAKTNLCDCVITLSDVCYVYDGKEKKPSVTVMEASMTLTAGTDYTVSYINNTYAGTALAIVQGIGNYKGEQSVTFTIEKAVPELTFASNNLFKTTSDSPFTNTLTKTTDGTVTFTSSDTNVVTVNSTSGLVTIKGVGTVTITATASEGANYERGSAVYTLKIEALTPHVNGFLDVQDLSHPYYNAIYWAAEAGITKGYSDGTFGINKPCTRGEMLMFLWRFAGKPLPKAVWTSPFKDVPTGHTFFKAILWGYQAGITKGYSDGTFGINRNVSRGECMMFLWRVKGKPAPKTVSKSPFMDVPMNHAFYKAILWGSQKGITKGYTSGPKKGNFGINDNCTRGQIVTFLYRAMS